MNWFARWLTLGVVAVFLGSAFHTYTLYDETADEGQHIAVGMEWFFHHSSSLDPLTPPLAPAVTAIGPILIGVRPPPVADLWTRYDAESVGEQLLSGPNLRRTLYAARASTLVFYFLTVAWLWYRVRGWMGEGWACLAVAVFSLCPSVLTHASLANTDVATMALFVWALDRLWVLGQDRTPSNAIVAGVVVALGFLTKFTMGPFLVASVVVMLILSGLLFRHDQRRFRMVNVRTGLATATVFFLVVWAGYLFAVGSISDSKAGDAKFAARMQTRPFVGRLAVGLADHFPAPVLVKGIRYFRVVSSVQKDTGTYFLGRTRYGKVRYFFPAMFVFKMPLPFVLLTLAGISLSAVSLWRSRAPYLVMIVAGIAGPFAVGIASSVHAGLRHILSVVPFCSVLVVLAIHTMWHAQSRRNFWRGLAVIFICWQAVEFCTSLRDPLPWYNEVALGDADWVEGGTDYEYGQDMKMLAERLRDLHVDTISLCYFPKPDPARYGIVSRPLQPGVVTHGWVAIFGLTVRSNPQYQWLQAYTPVARAGTLNIYYIP